MSDDAVERGGVPRYFGNAAAGVMSERVLEATVGHLRREAEVGAPTAAAEASSSIDAGRADAALLIGAGIGEVAFVESGNRALAALIQSAGLRSGDHVLVDRTCWGGTLEMLSSFPGVIVDVMPVDDFGRVDVAATRAMADAATKLIVLTWSPATCGMYNPAEKVGALAAELGVFYVVDACQVVGRWPVDVAAIRCHGLAASGRKWLRGPRGTALLYASRDYLAATRPFMPDQFGSDRADARRYETGEHNVAGHVGLAEALREANEVGASETARLIADKAAMIRDRIGGIEAASIVERGPHMASFVTFNLEGWNAADVAADLGRRGIVVSSPGRAYAPLDMDARGLSGVVRVAPHVFTTSTDIDALVEAIGELAGRPYLDRQLADEAGAR